MPRGPKGERRPADVIGNAVLCPFEFLQDAIFLSYLDIVL
jgi:hypothetical protein